jgi:Coenzyme PQQ synthesis protein D (PqqD)
MPHARYDASVPPLTPDDRLVPDSLVLCVRHEGDTVLLNAASGRYFGLNPVGTEVWDAILDGKRLADIITFVADQYSLLPSRASEDVLRLASALREHGLAHAEL